MSNTETNMDGYKKTKLGWIPEEWDFIKMGEKVDLLTGYPFSSNSYSNKGIRLLRGANIKRGELSWGDDITVYWDNHFDKLDKFELRLGDLVIAMDGSLVGRSFAQVNSSDLPSYLLQRVARIRSEELDINFLKHLISSMHFVRYCDSVKTVTAIPHISSKDLNNFSIPTPSYTEQKKIAEILSTWDEAIQKTEALIKKKERLKKGLMQQLLTGKRRLPGFNDKWREVKLGKLISTFSGGTPSRQKQEYYNGSIPWIKSGELNQRRIHTTEEKISSEALAKSSAKLVHKGALLLAIYGATAGVISVNMMSSAAINQAILALIPLDNKIDIGFLELWFLYNKDKIIHTFTQGGQPNLSAKIVKSLKLNCPSIEEQKRISRLLFAIEDDIQGLKVLSDCIKSQKKGLMQQLLTGKTRVKVNK